LETFFKIDIFSGDNRDCGNALRSYSETRLSNLLRANYCPRVAAVSCTQKTHKTCDLDFLTFDSTV